MTGEAGESAVTVAKTSGAVQVRRFMANVPGIGPVAVVVQIACLAVACATEAIDLHCRQLLGF
jgi:hypothetical protein